MYASFGCRCMTIFVSALPMTALPYLPFSNSKNCETSCVIANALPPYARIVRKISTTSSAARRLESVPISFQHSSMKTALRLVRSSLILLQTKSSTMNMDRTSRSPFRPLKSNTIYFESRSMLVGRLYAASEPLMSGLRMLRTRCSSSTPAISSYRSPSSGIFLYSCVTASNSESLSVVMPNLPYRLYRQVSSSCSSSCVRSRTTRPRNVLMVWIFFVSSAPLSVYPSIRIKSSSSGTRMSMMLMLLYADGSMLTNCPPTALQPPM